MFEVDRLNFSQVRDAYPDRYEKVDLAADKIVSDDGARFVVQRDGGDGHVCQLVESLSHVWGTCSCDGYQYNDGPCSHLCGIWRAESAGLVEIPTGKAESISVEVRDRQQELADHAAEPDQPARADGGFSTCQ